jgi:hypothetical protein
VVISFLTPALLVLLSIPLKISYIFLRFFFISLCKNGSNMP